MTNDRNEIKVEDIMDSKDLEKLNEKGLPNNYLQHIVNELILEYDDGEWSEDSLHEQISHQFIEHLKERGLLQL